MKAFFVVFLACTNSFLSLGQTLPIPEPEYLDEVYLVEGSSYRKLEKKETAIKGKSSASSYLVGIGKTRIMLEVKGSRSNVRVNIRDSISLIYRIGIQELDPAIEIKFIKLETNQRKGLRTTEEWTGDIDRDTEDMIPFIAKPYGTQSFLITATGLLPGEYALTSRVGAIFHLFAVD